MANYYDDSWLTTNRWGKWGKDDEVGAMNEMTDATKLAALSLIKKGKVYDLETERFKGMPIWGGHCGFDMMSYASPRGRRNMLESHLDSEFSWYAPGGMCDPAGADFFKMGLNTEIMVAPLHLGTHIDAFCHWTTGEDDHWYNGFTGDKYCTNFGPVRCDASKIPPIVTRGVLLDIAGYKGLDVLPDNYIITAEDAEGCAKWEGVELKPGDSVLLRTGQKWPACNTAVNAGLSVNCCRYLVEGCGAILVADDQASVEGFNADGSSSWPNHPQPVHHYLLIQNGVHILEFAQLDELAADKAYEFCFICLPSKVYPATGMFCRPIAIV